MIGDIHRPLFVLLGAVGFVLLIACANVASLTLGRIAARDAELALRTALGAARTRIARQIFTESLLLAIAGGVLGLGLALVGLKLLTAIAPADLPRLNEVRLDGSVLAFTFGLTLLTGILFGVVPALQGTSKDLHVRLRSAGRGTEGRRATARSRRTLVVVEMALAIVLLAGAGLLLRSFTRLADVDPGFRADRVATFNVSLPSTKYGEPEQRRVFISELLDGIGRAPQVTDAAVSFALPLDGDSFGFTFEIRGRELPAGAEEPRAQARVASEGYFRAMGIPLLSGRLFDARDRYRAEQALVISAEVARRYFPGEDPMGKYLETGWGMDERRFGGQVIGIVGDVRQYSLDGDKTPHIYMVHEQWPLSDYEVVVRSTAPVATTLRAARTVLRALDPEIPMNDARPLQEIVDASLGPRRFYLTLLGTFAAVAVVLALVGIYGVIAYGVRLRQKEIGVRLALGASRGRVLRMVLSDGLRVAIAGVAIGVAAALGLTSLLDSLLFGVGSRDPLTFVAVPVALMVAALIACVMPALRAAGLDPVQTIRAE